MGRILNTSTVNLSAKLAAEAPRLWLSTCRARKKGKTAPTTASRSRCRSALPRREPFRKGGAARRGRRVLLAEDDASMRRLLLLCLRADGFEVIEAATGGE